MNEIKKQQEEITVNMEDVARVLMIAKDCVARRENRDVVNFRYEAQRHTYLEYYEDKCWQSEMGEIIACRHLVNIGKFEAISESESDFPQFRFTRSSLEK